MANSFCGGGSLHFRNVAVLQPTRNRKPKREEVARAPRLAVIVAILFLTGCRTCAPRHCFKPSPLKVEVEASYKYEDGTVTLRMGKEFPRAR